MINLKNSVYYLLLSAFLLVGSAASADEHTVNLKGYVKTLASLTDFTGLDLESTGSRDDVPDHEGAWTNTLRLSLFWQPDESTTAELAYELMPRLQDANGSESFFVIRAANPLSYRALDFGEKLCCSHDNSDFQIFQNLDRAFVTLSPDFADIYIGRQPVAFGSARVVNPTDILTSYAYTEINREERIGVDAVRMKIPVGAMSELDIGAVFGSDFSIKESAAFFRARYYLFETDVSPVAMLFKQNLLAGIDIARSIGDAGYWFEGGYVFADIADHHDPDQDYARISTGLDYSFSDNIYIYIEYHFNGAGKSRADDYGNVISAEDKETAYEDGAVYLLGKHYLAPGVNYQITPLVTIDTGVLYNIDDSSLLLFPRFQYSLSDEALLEAGGYIGFGKGSKIVRNADTGEVDISTNSEFGLYPDTYFISARLYF